jgi:putative restriction endonuclease
MYDLTGGSGLALWNAVQTRVAARLPLKAASNLPISAMLGKPQLVTPRLGQGGFRISVIDAYERRCAVTGERTLPALDAAHIRPFAEVQRHEVVNGVTLRSDIHRLFDARCGSATLALVNIVSRGLVRRSVRVAHPE